MSDYLTNFHKDRTQIVQLEGQSSSTATVLPGVPQRTVLVLFLTFINDLPETTKSEAQLFADDCLLYLYQERCVHIQVFRKRNTINTKYIPHNHQLESVESNKNLRVTIKKDQINILSRPRPTASLYCWDGIWEDVKPQHDRDLSETNPRIWGSGLGPTHWGNWIM